VSGPLPGVAEAVSGGIQIGLAYIDLTGLTPVQLPH